MFPQLRVRSGYTFKEVYGRHPEIIARLKELGCEVAALVDNNTWGHVRWEKECRKNDIKPMFGMEIPIIDPDADPKKGFKPKAWILALDLKSFYNATTLATQRGGLTRAEFGALDGVVKFCGGAVELLRPEDYDYIDVNPSSFLLAKRQALAHRSGGRPLVLTGYNHTPSPEHVDFAYAWEVRDTVKPHCIVDVEDLRKQLKGILTEDELNQATTNAVDIANGIVGLDLKLRKAPIIHLAGDMVKLAREGMEYRLKAGHIKEWTQEYEDRFNEEIHQIQLKDFDSYFLVVADLVRFAKTKMLVGPARGSSAGSLVCYCLGITEVDPIPYKLLFARFIDVSRADLPDIDIDFEDTKRYMVFDYLKEKYGEMNVAKLGNINTLKANSVMAQVGKKFNIGYHETANIKNALLEYSSGDARYGHGLEDTFATTTTGQEFVAKYPDAARCMGDLEIHPSHTGVHAAGIIVCNDPISDYCTVTAEGIAQIDKPDSEYLNLLKLDALGLRTLGIISDTGVIDAETLYGIKLDDQSVLDILNENKMSGIFQFEGDAVRSVTNFVHVDNFNKIDNLTALGRPGPLSSGMAQKYIERAAGRAPIEYDVPQLEPYLKETYGVFLYQEQIMAVVKEIGSFDWAKTSAVRKAMSGRKGEEYFNKLGEDFVAGAINNGVPEADARKLWQAMATFGSWGFNKSHSVSYAVVTYWTLWLKRHYPLEFAAACLRAAKDEDQTIAILRELAKEGVDYVPIDPDHSSMNWTIANGKLIGGIMNAKGYGMVKAMKYIEAREAGTLTQKQKDALANAEVKYGDLTEMHTKFGWAYNDPYLIGVTSGASIRQMKEVGDDERAIVIGKLTKKVLADENEATRIRKRLERGIYTKHGKLKKGLQADGRYAEFDQYGNKLETQFIDLMCKDDSTDSPMRFRIRPEKFQKYGKYIAENVGNGAFFLMKGRKLEGIDMFIVDVIKQVYPDGNK